jgi:hypothetical protein
MELAIKCYKDFTYEEFTYIYFNLLTNQYEDIKPFLKSLFYFQCFLQSTNPYDTRLIILKRIQESLFRNLEQDNVTKQSQLQLVHKVYMPKDVKEQHS